MRGDGDGWRGLGGGGHTMNSAVPKIWKAGMNCNTCMCNTVCVTQGKCVLVGFKLGVCLCESLCAWLKPRK